MNHLFIVYIRRGLDLAWIRPSLSPFVLTIGFDGTAPLSSQAILVRNGPKQRTDTGMLLLMWPYYVLANSNSIRLS